MVPRVLVLVSASVSFFPSFFQPSAMAHFTRHRPQQDDEFVETPD